MFFENYHLNPKILTEQSLIFWKAFGSIWEQMKEREDLLPP